MQKLKEETVAALENTIQRSIEYDSISPSLLLYLEMRNVGITTLTPEGRKNVDIGKIRIYYHFGKLVRGDIASSIKEVSLINSTFNIDQVRDKNLISLVRGLTEGVDGSTSEEEKNGGFPENLKISGRNINIEYSNKNRAHRFGDLIFEIGTTGENLEIDLRGGTHVLFKGGLRFKDLALHEAQTDFKLSGQYYMKEKEFSSRLTLKDFSSDLFDFGELTLGIVRNSEKLTLRKIEDRSPYDFTLEYADPGNLQIKFEGDRFVPENNITPTKNLSPYSEWFNSVISGEAVMNYSFASENISYSGNLELELENSFLPFPLSLSIEGEGNEDYTVFDDLSITSKKLSGSYRGRVKYENLSATGTLSLKKFLLNEKNSLSGTMSILGDLEGFQISAPEVSIDTISIKDLEIEGSLKERELAFYVQALYTGDLRMEEAGSGVSKKRSPNIEAGGTLRFDTNRFLELSLSAEHVPIDRLVEEFAPEDRLDMLPYGGHFFSTNAYLTTNFERFSFSLFPITIESEDGRVVAKGSVDGNNERLRVEDVAFQFRDYDAAGDIEVLRSDEKTYTFKTVFSVNSLFYELDGVYHQPGTLIVRGNYDIYLSVVFGSGFNAFSARVKDLPLPLEKNRISDLSFRGRGSFSDSERWNLQVASFSAVNLPKMPPENRVDFSGTFLPGVLQLNKISYFDSVSNISGDAELRYDSVRPFEGNLRLNMQSSDGQEFYRFVGSRKSDLIRANIQLQNAQTGRIPDFPLRGIVNGSLNVEGTMEDPEVTYSITLDRGQYKQNSLELESNGKYSDQILNLSYLRAVFDNHILQRGEGIIDLKGGKVDLTGQYRGIFMKRQTSAEITLEGLMDSDISPMDLVTEQQPFNFSAALNLENIRVFGESREDWLVRIEKEDNDITFNGGPGNALQGSLGEGGAFSFVLSEPLPLRCDVQGNRSYEQFGVKVRDIGIEADFLKLLGVSVVDFSNGLITGNLDISGAPNDPQFNGTFTATNFSGQVQYVKGQIDPFSTNIILRQKEARVNPVNITVGEGAALLSGGFSFDRWNLDTLDINVEAFQAQPIPVLFRNATSGLNIDGYAYGTFQFAMTSEKSGINGNLTAQNCIITLEESRNAPMELPTKPLEVDLNLTTGRRIEFLWPRKNLPILQAFADTNQKISVKYDSITTKFTLKGDVDLKSGQLYYFQRNFYIEEGTIVFNESESKFDPLLQVDAQIREIDNSGSPVTISLLVDNEPLSSFTPRFESSPPLSTIEIASILGTNLNTQFNRPQGELTSALMLTGDLFSQFSIVRSFEQQMKDVFKLDLFSIRTQMIQNVILERVLNQNITRDPEANASLGQYLDNTTLFLGKYLGNDLFLEAMLQIRQEPITAGVFVEDELDLTLEVGLEWKTPFFLLNFSVNPDFEEPLNSLENTSLGFSWDHSY